jgi:hypothetical protein
MQRFSGATSSAVSQRVLYGNACNRWRGSVFKRLLSYTEQGRLKTFSRVCALESGKRSYSVLNSSRFLGKRIFFAQCVRKLVRESMSRNLHSLTSLRTLWHRDQIGGVK